MMLRDLCGKAVIALTRSSWRRELALNRSGWWRGSATASLRMVTSVAPLWRWQLKAFTSVSTFRARLRSIPSLAATSTSVGVRPSSAASARVTASISFWRLHSLGAVPISLMHRVDPQVPRPALRIGPPPLPNIHLHGLGLLVADFPLAIHAALTQIIDVRYRYR